MTADDRLTNAERTAIAALDKPTISDAEIQAKFPGYWAGPAIADAAQWKRRALSAEQRAIDAEAEIRRLLALYPAGVTP